MIEGLVAPTRRTPRGRQTPTRVRVLLAISASLLCLARAPLLTAAPVPLGIAATEIRSSEPREERAATGKVPGTKPRTRAKLPSYAPRAWLPSRGLECIRKGANRGFCAGPRKVPRPHGAAAALADRLGLGGRIDCARLLGTPPPAAWVKAAQAAGAAPKWLWPLESKQIVRGVGNLALAQKRRQREFSANPPKHKPARHEHEGVDVLAPQGALIRAMQHGLVVYSDNTITGYGNLIIVLHKDASIALYAHAKANYVFPGQRVQRGQIIGEVGTTGYARGPHLHFEYRVNGYAKDPMPLFAPH